MSAALQVIRSVIDNGSRGTMRDLRAELFLEDERPLYEFVSGFYQRHGGLPTVQIMQEQGFRLPPANGPLSYFIDRLRERAIYFAVSAVQTQLDDAMRARDTATVATLVRGLGRQIDSVEGARDVIPLGELFADVLTEALLARMNGASGMVGTTFGWEPADRATGGLQPGDVVSVVARPNMGKSWDLLHMAIQAWLSGASVMFLTMEMTAVQIARRMLGDATGINPEHIKRGWITSWGEEILHDFVEGVGGMPPFHIMAGNFRKTTADFDRAMQEFQPDVGYIDAAYLVSSEKKQRSNGARWERIYDVGEEIKGIAQARNKPLVMTLQLGREKKEGVEFDLSQIAGGDVIGQISTVVGAVDYPIDPLFKTTRRRFIGGKNRDGPLFEFEHNFLFNPVDMSAIPPEDPSNIRDHLERAI